MSNPMMEKVMKELQKYIDDHRDGIKSDDDYDRLTRQFMKEYNASLRAGKSGGPETADDYLMEAEKAGTLSGRISNLRKALSPEPEECGCAVPADSQLRMQTAQRSASGLSGNA